MRRINYYIALLAVLIVAGMASPLDVDAQNLTQVDSNSLNLISSHQKFKRFLQKMQYTGNFGTNMYGNTFLNSCINHLGRKNESYSMGGMKAALEIKYNIWGQSHWELYAGLGYAYYNQSFKNDFVYLERKAPYARFVHTYDVERAEVMEDRQPYDFGLSHNFWDTSFGVSYITLPISLAYKTGKFEYGITLSPSIHIGNTYLYRDISVGSGEDLKTLYYSKDSNVEEYVNDFILSTRLTCLYASIVGLYMEMGSLSMTKGMEYDIFVFSVGLQFQFSPRFHK